MSRVHAATAGVLSHPDRLPIPRWLRGRWVTALLGMAAVLPFSAPSLPAVLEYDGHRPWEIWRWVTCHFAHFAGDHLFWSGSVFVALAAWLEPLSRRRLLLCITVAALAIPAALALLLPELPSYRGLSGIDSALFASALVALAVQARAEGSRGLAVLSALAGAAFLTKTVYELAVGAAVFADSAAFEPVPLAHAVGAAVGLACSPWNSRVELGRDH